MKINYFIFVVLILASCRTKKSSSYSIYSGGETTPVKSEEVTQVNWLEESRPNNEDRLQSSEEEADTALMSVETDWMSKTNFNNVLNEENDSLAEVISLDSISVVNDSLSDITIVADTSLVNEVASLEVPNDSIFSVENTVLNDSLPAEIYDTIQNSSMLIDSNETNMPFMVSDFDNSVDSIFGIVNQPNFLVSQKATSPLYIIDGSIGKHGQVYVQVDTITPLNISELQRTVIVIRKVRLDTEKILMKKTENTETVQENTQLVEKGKAVFQSNLVEDRVFDFYYLPGKKEPSNNEVMEAMLKEIKLKMPNYISISSSTDASGSTASNMKLSQVRVQEVKDFLEKNGVDEKIIFIQYFGEKYATLPNDDMERKTVVLLR